jgi:glycosyltransferase involved in cell wall biosynthesis
MRLKEKFGIDFEVISSSTELNYPQVYRLDGVKVERIVSKRARNLNRKFSHSPLRRITNAMLSHTEARTVRGKLARTSFDLIHTFGYSPATAAAIKMRQDLRIPLVLELVNPLHTPYQYLPGTRAFTNQDLHHQSLIVAISKSLGDMCASFGIVDNVWVRPNPVDIEKFSISTDQERISARNKISSVSENETLIVYVAKYIARKNHAFLLDVMTKLPKSFKLILTGPPRTDRDLVPGLKADEITTLKKRAQELGVDERVIISHGFVDMEKYLTGADVFCFPAEREAMGTPLLESISSGVPVVANANESSFQEWVKDGKNGYLCPLIPENWAEAIVKASKFSNDKKLVMSEEIKSTVSTDLIDEQYHKLLTALASTKYLDKFNVKQALSS